MKPLVTIEDFAEIACMDGYAFGVKTRCPSCDFILNPCLRRNLHTRLIENQHRLERALGYDVAAQYHSEEIIWDGRSRLNLSRFGVSEVNVKEQITKLTNSPFDIDYFIAEDATVDTVDGYHIITLDADLIDNPSDADPRVADANGALTLLEMNGYPCQDNNGDWLISVEEAVATSDVRHCKLATVTIPTPACTGGEIQAFYPGTTDYIPFAKAPVVSGGNTTYYFYIWSLVNHAFKDDSEINLINGQFYKLLTTIDLACVTDATALPVVTNGRLPCNGNLITSGEVATTDLLVDLIDDNVVDIFWTQACGSSASYPIRIKLFYKTDPTLLNVDTQSMKEAVAYLTAAELPIKVCNCDPPTYGFVYDAQQHYGTLKINPITGAESWQVAYGDMHGQMVFAERLHSAKKRKVPALI